jgi:hypothetical protein
MNPPTFPARPMTGGPLERARQKLHPDMWRYEPKINGWRVLIDVRNKKLWSRYNQPSSVEHKYASVLDRLTGMFDGVVPTWLDGEILGQRTPTMGRGSIIIFDVVWPQLTEQHKEWNLWYERRRFLNATLGGEAELWDVEQTPRQDTIYHLPNVCDDEAEEFYQRLKLINTRLGVELYEGLVAKRVDREYPMQLASPAKETTNWIKHRWDY